MNDIYDIAVVGAGPSGLSVGVAAREAGLSCVIFDRGCVCQSIALYPTYGHFFSTADRLELGGVPFISQGDKPTRAEALKYYRRIVTHFHLDVRQYVDVTGIEKDGDAFVVSTDPMHAQHATVRARNVVIASGYAGQPNMLDVPGEDLDKVSHYFSEAHHAFDMDVAVVGAGNSAVEAALDLFRAGARVTLVHFLDRLDDGVKPWILPDITNRLKNGEIDARWYSRISEIRPGSILLRHDDTGATEELPNHFVYAMTGYRPDPGLLTHLGATIDLDTGIPTHDPASMETDVPGVFIAGVMAGGNRPDRIFIETGRLHGGRIATSITSR